MRWEWVISNKTPEPIDRLIPREELLQAHGTFSALGTDPVRVVE